MRPFSALADFLYPPACSVCGISTVGHRGLCAKCWSGIRFIERPYCEVLGIPFSHDLGTGILSAEAIANPPPFDRLRSAATRPCGPRSRSRAQVSRSHRSGADDGGLDAARLRRHGRKL
ncbi:hypothetical protein ACVITL_004026 [Rhizobium pisi]